jgi:hypothetical protein
MMLAEPDEIDAELVGEDSFIDDVANNLRMRFRRSILAHGNVAECIEPKFKDMLQRSFFSMGGCHGSFNPLHLLVTVAPQSDGRSVDFANIARLRFCIDVDDCLQ